VRREPDPRDGRASLITPTPRGRELADTLVTRVRAEVLRLLEPLETRDRDQLAELLHVILAAADSADGLLPQE
jgi:DNA-binding MarR family transcriptional regulator